MTISAADKSGLQEILDLQYLAYQSEAELLNDFSIPPLKQTYIEVLEEYAKGIFLKATDEDGNLIGSVRAYIADNTGFIAKLIVHPARQGQGIGTKLLLAVEHECHTNRYELFTSSKSIKNIRLYKRLGYVRFKEHVISDCLSFVYLEKYANGINVNSLHTTDLGKQRIRHNLNLDIDDVVAWCKQAVLTADENAVARKGKNWYVSGNGFIITINANSHTIITAHQTT